MSYKAKHQDDGSWTVYGVNIFEACDQQRAYDLLWMKGAVNQMQSLEEAGFQPPVMGPPDPETVAANEDADVGDATEARIGHMSNARIEHERIAVDFVDVTHYGMELLRSGKYTSIAPVADHGRIVEVSIREASFQSILDLPSLEIEEEATDRCDGEPVR